MKNFIFTVMFMCSIMNIFAQDFDVDSAINYAKTQFHSETTEPDYKTAVELLEKVVEIQPKNAEAYYVLGYLYDAINADYTVELIAGSSLTLTLKASVAIEKSIELEPRYTGELIILDPYTKLTSIWGAYAFVQYYYGNIDSAKWALSEGKKRGGFSDYSLSNYRKVLEKCSENALLFSTGDLSFFSILYLQLIENVRTDVISIELSHISLGWYFQFLWSQKKVPFSITPKQYKKLEKDIYRKWNPKPLTIKTPHGKFTWTPVTKHKNTLIYTEEIMLDLLKTNKFKKDIYFTEGTDPYFYYLGINNFFITNFISNRVNYDKQEKLTVNQIVELVKYIYEDIDLFNSAVTSDFSCLLIIRIHILNQIYKYIYQNKMEEACLLYDTFTSLDNIEKNPYLAKDTALEEYHKTIILPKIIEYKENRETSE